ncbi:hypothetical protein MSAN_00096400 [Mycena sanguinolenta]|uniref:Uncharacterized protein n=1 Tax=Mycena sanguinolenta TaxID=230812 RepID=A0A8H6ZI90_9AGAR|nr:hypothetical protein MSAN_00096400 [Mycena sanguinolenta]
MFIFISALYHRHLPLRRRFRYHRPRRNCFVIILPVLLCLANLGSSVWLMIALANLETGLSPTVWGNIVFKCLNLFLSLTLCTNIVCTTLISFRIISLHRQITHLSLNTAPPTYTVRAMSIIVESAAIYTLVLVGALVSNRANSFVNSVFFDCKTGIHSRSKQIGSFALCRHPPRSVSL